MRSNTNYRKEDSEIELNRERSRSEQIIRVITVGTFVLAILGVIGECIRFLMIDYPEAIIEESRTDQEQASRSELYWILDWTPEAATNRDSDPGGELIRQLSQLRTQARNCRSEIAKEENEAARRLLQLNLRAINEKVEILEKELQKNNTPLY